MIDRCDQHSSTTDGPDGHGGAGGTNFGATVEAVIRAPCSRQSWPVAVNSEPIAPPVSFWVTLFHFILF